MNLLSGVDQDFHRPQTSPGGYEWWYFDGTDEKSGLSFTLRFSAGDLFSAYYQDNLKTYWQRTKSPLAEPNAFAPAPPNPLDHCGVSFQVFQQGHLIGGTTQEFTSVFLKASDQQGAVLLGPNRFNWDAGDPPSYVITVQSPLGSSNAVLRARLFFTPLTGPLGPLPQPEFTSTHNWVLAAPLCHVEGTLQWCDRAGEVKKEMGFVGKGYHDHHFGSVPLERFVESWHRGRAFLGEKTLVYSAQTFADKNESPEGILYVFQGNKLEKIERGLKVRPIKRSRNFFWLPYVKELTFGKDLLKVRHEGILDNGPVHLTLQDQITLNGNVQGSGLSNFLYTPRLSKALFFPMIKGQTVRYTRKASLDATPPDKSGGVSIERPE
jgi:carotenoid 1,2-hydratase